MNELKLLTKGRSFKGLTDTTGMYKLPSGNVLPNFAAHKHSPTMSHGPPASLQTALFEHPPRVEEAPATAPTPAPAGASPSPPGIWRRAAGAWGRFCRSWMTRSKASPPHLPSVQTELALDKVRVVRNDLSEDDLEVVTVEKKEMGRQNKEAEREKLTADP